MTGATRKAPTDRRRALATTILVAAAFATLACTSAAAATITKNRVAAAVPKLEKLAKKIIADGGAPGLAIGIVYKDEVIYLGGFGVRDTKNSGAVDADTVFQLASLSKPISSTIIAALVSDGVVDWGSRISDLDPGFQLHNAYPTAQVTIRDLLAHRSGLSGNAGNDLEGLGFARDHILHQLRYLKPTSSFRAGYAYSNFGFTEAAVAAAKPTGKAWEDVAQEKLYGPLGMKSTSSRNADFVKHANRASLHVRVNGKWTPLVTRNPDPQSPAGGVSSNVRDLAQWMRLELGDGKYEGKQLIKETALAATHVPLMERGNHAVTKAPSFYGLGWNISYGRYGMFWNHAGAFSQGARTVANLMPSEQLGIVVLSNAFPTGVPDALASSFFDLVFTGTLTRDWVPPWNGVYESIMGSAIEAAKAAYGKPPAAASPALPATAYAGTYRNDYLGTATIVANKGSLTLKLGPKGIKAYKLEHFDRDLFTYFPDAEAPDIPSGVTFQIGPDQKASQIMIENLNDDGQGALNRVEKSPNK